MHLKGYGFIKVFRTVAPNGDVEHWATSELTMTPGERDRLAKQAWGIEEYHRGLKQCRSIERSHVRKATAQIAHILLPLRAFVRLEMNRLKGVISSWYAAKQAIIRPAIRAYLTHP